MGILKIQMVFSISHQSLKWGQKRNPKVLYLKVFVEQIHHIKTVRSEKRKKLLKSENLTNRLLQENHSKAIIIYHTITFGKIFRVLDRVLDRVLYAHYKPMLQ